MSDQTVAIIVGVGGIVLGAALAWLAALYGATKEAKREHARWLRVERYKVWGDIITVGLETGGILRHDIGFDPATNQDPRMAEKATLSMDRGMAMMERIAVLSGPLRLLGPPDVFTRGMDVLRSAHEVAAGQYTADAEHLDAIGTLAKGVAEFADFARSNLDAGL